MGLIEACGDVWTFRDDTLPVMTVRVVLVPLSGTGRNTMDVHLSTRTWNIVKADGEMLAWYRDVLPTYPAGEHSLTDCPHAVTALHRFYGLLPREDDPDFWPDAATMTF